MNFLGLDKKYSIIAKGIVLILATGAVVYGAWGLWQYYQATNNPNPVIPKETVVHSTGKPDETKIDEACEEYTVAADRPQKLTVESLSIDSCIQPVGVDQNDAIAVPTNIHLTGWFTGSALPGEAGVSIIDGHVGGRYTDAVFKNLHELQPGDDVAVEFGDNETKQFEVIDSNSYSVAEATEKMLNKIDGVDRQLTLITCGGTYNTTSQTYNQRLIVRAQLKT